ncbi:COG4223 family protein [Rhizobium sp. 2YAF20]|uniref:COG4223 family protein n=1 Tax=Rhizobium sp. 2YAF20 TaxID=3233027 RepID=UPI003F96F259
MVSGNPPNHSKTPDEPVTIDLEADRTAHAADAEAAIGHRDGETGSSSADEVEMPLDSENEALAAREDAGAGAQSPKAPADEEQRATFAHEPTSEQHQRPGATSGLIAAGIVGGLIALIGAGAIQYAGLLPGGSSAKSNFADISALSAEIDGLKQTVANLAAAPPAKPDGELEARIAALETAAKTIPQAAAPTDATSSDPAASQKIADLTNQLAQLKATITQATQTQASTGADISKRLDDAEKKLNEPGKDTAVARAIAAAALKAAIDRGGPFRPELDTFAGVSPDDPAVADLRNFADIGVPSRTDLIRQVPDVATTIVGVTQQPIEGQSWSERLMASAKSLVKVRPVGNVEGDSVDAIAARFEDKVKNGDLPGAVTEWNSLPPAGKAASAAFKQSVEARIRVEDLVGEALSKAIAGAGKQS